MKERRGLTINIANIMYQILNLNEAKAALKKGTEELFTFRLRDDFVVEIVKETDISNLHPLTFVVVKL